MPTNDKLTSEPSIPGFIEWLQRKDPNEKYDWTKASSCACGQYHLSLDEQNKPGCWIGTVPVWNELNSVARGDDGDPKKGPDLSGPCRIWKSRPKLFESKILHKKHRGRGYLKTAESKAPQPA